MSLLGRLLINAAALWVAIRLVPGVSFTGSWWLLFAVALVFGVLNASVRPIMMLLTLPFFLITLGLFTFVLNGFMLWLTSALSGAFGARVPCQRIRRRIRRRPRRQHRQLRFVNHGMATHRSRASANQVVTMDNRAISWR